MKDLFNHEHAKEFVDRINQLSVHSKAQWGKMNVSQMLTHAQIPLQIASGAIEIKPNPIIKFLFGKRAKKQLNNNDDFKKNLPTFKEAIFADEREFEKEKEKLISLIKNFQAKGAEGIIKKPHPFFGELTIMEWNTLQTKHLDHHLKQFGV
jgi:hypothetical protein